MDKKRDRLVANSFKSDHPVVPDLGQHFLFRLDWAILRVNMIHCEKNFVIFKFISEFLSFLCGVLGKGTVL